MREHYLVRAVYKSRNSFLVWYSDDEDGVLLLDGSLLLFESIDEAMSFAEKQGFLLDINETEFDFTSIFELLKGIEVSENCSKLINIWNFFSDLARSLDKEFIGDSDEGLTMDIYNKLFYGINLGVLKNEEYHPTFDDEEEERCVSIFNDGLSILDKQFDVFYA